MFLQPDFSVKKKVMLSRFKANFFQVTQGHCSLMLVKTLRAMAWVVIKHGIIIRNFRSVRHFRTTVKTSKTLL